MYYVDTYTWEIVKEIDKYAPPERYYQYRKGAADGVIIETYITSYEPLTLLDYAHPINEERGAENRKIFLESHNVSINAQLYAYTVPPSWFEEMTAKI